MIPIAEPQFGPEERERIDAVLSDGYVADGPEVRRFESEFADYCGAECGVATSNGTTALHAALHGIGIGAGDRVLTTPFTFISTANAVVHVGGEVGFVDIDPTTYNIDPNRLEERLRAGEQVDAVIAVHLYGLPAAMDHLTELAEEYDFALVEDAAQAHGAEFAGRRVGSIGDVGTFSFYPTKNMTCGEGGMVLTDDEEIAARARQLIDHGRTSGYHHDTIGYNFRMSSINAAVGRAQLERLPGFTARRRENAAMLTDLLADTPLVLPTVPEDRTHVFHQYTVSTEGSNIDRDRLAEQLEARGVGSKAYYPVPVNRQRAYDHITADTPVSDACAESVLSLPVHPAVSPEDIETVAEAVSESTKELAGGVR
jgi:dTDP-4-amino-4,6-dideoxygalactose transaminase